MSVVAHSKSWFFITADYAFGKVLEATMTEAVLAGGGDVADPGEPPLADLSAPASAGSASAGSASASSGSGSGADGALKAS